jgi:mannitol/fructose-specific phosphotransferase system IIA component (Ntr-type)
MKITEILKPDCIRVPLRSTEKVAAITELVDLLHEHSCFTDRDEVLRAVLDRERTRSTGIGLGLAVPHGKSRGCKHLAMAVGRTATPMSFDAVDGRPCDFIVLLASPVDETGPHIQALARVSRLWQNEDFRRSVNVAKTAEELYAAVDRHQH